MLWPLWRPASRLLEFCQNWLFSFEQFCLNIGSTVHRRSMSTSKSPVRCCARSSDVFSSKKQPPRRAVDKRFRFSELGRPINTRRHFTVLCWLRIEFPAVSAEPAPMAAAVFRYFSSHPVADRPTPPRIGLSRFIIHSLAPIIPPDSRHSPGDFRLATVKFAAVFSRSSWAAAPQCL